MIIIQGAHAKKLMNIIRTVQDARARIRSKHVEVSTVSTISVLLQLQLNCMFERTK